MSPTAEAAEAYNKQLRQTAGVLSGHSGGAHEYPFLCECGCEQPVKLTLREFDRQGGAWLEAHRPASADAQP